MRTVHVEGAIRLKVEETDQVLDALKNAKILKRLSGRQRQQLEDAIAVLTMTRTRAAQGWVEVPTHVAARVLRSVALTQQWLGEMFEEFGTVELD
jgi:hypothetical protein